VKKRHLAELFNLKLAHEREIRQERESAAKSALDLQAREYERRLDTLNHAHEDARRAQADTVPREMFEAFKAENQKWQTTVTEALAEARGAAARQTALFAGLLALMTLVSRFWR
jgi:hypothetical protein